MFLQYGSYRHAVNESGISIRKSPVFNDAGIRHSLRESWQIRGVLQAADLTLLTLAINQLVAAYSIPDRNLGLFFDNGAATSHGMLSARTLGGIRVVDGPNFPQGEGAEYTTYRSYEITVEADFADATVQLLAWTENLSFTGGGPRFVMHEPLNGPARRVKTHEATAFRVRQNGSALGHFTYPQPAPPIWPAFEDVDQRVIEPGQPKRHGNGYAEFPINWSYVFSSPASLQGLPHLWPAT